MSATKWDEILAVRSKSKGEAVLLLMAWFADAMKVRESGYNAGYWVERFQHAANVERGAPWCAAAITFCCKALDVASPKPAPARVYSWMTWGKTHGLLVKSPNRGDLCLWLNKDTTGHIGIVVRVVGPFIQTIEANTSSGDSGSQSDGDGLFRRTRLKSKFGYFIRLDGVK